MGLEASVSWGRLLLQVSTQRMFFFGTCAQSNRQLGDSRFVLRGHGSGAKMPWICLEFADHASRNAKVHILPSSMVPEA